MIPSGLNVVRARPDTTYYLASGVHTLGTSQFDQIDPAYRDRFIGAPGAILDGEKLNLFAFEQNARDVHIEYLTIQHFMAPQDQGVVNTSSSEGWVVKHDTIRNNPIGVGMTLGPRNVIAYDCFSHNGETGFNAYHTYYQNWDLTVTNNEITHNDTDGYDHPGGIACGCGAGGKFWSTTGATIVGNFVHDNNGPGLWVDTDNAGFLISHNFFSNNWAEGLIYEASYNAHIIDNVFLHNAWGKGPSVGDGFPTAAIYISNSGSSPHVKTPFRLTFLIADNRFLANWGGVALWDAAGRFCGDTVFGTGGDNRCTLIRPSVFTLESCAAHLPSASPGQVPDYYDGCRWKTQNVLVTHNSFSFNPTTVGPSCTGSNGCGFNSLFSEYGIVAPYMGDTIAEAVGYHQNNHFSDNVYQGPWSFLMPIQGDVVSWQSWRHSPRWQDAGSVHRL